MSPATGDILRSLRGALRLARLDPSGMADFDVSVDGFWRSFAAPVLLAPFYALLVVLQRGAGPDQDLIDIVLPGLLGYSAAWAAFPLVMVVFVRAFGLGAGYVPFIVAYNWSQAVIMMPLLGVALLAGTDLLPRALASSGFLAVFVASLGYLWFIARVALGALPLPAIMVVAIEVLLGAVIQGSIERLI